MNKLSCFYFKTPRHKRANSLPLPSGPDPVTPVEYVGDVWRRLLQFITKRMMATKGLTTYHAE